MEFSFKINKLPLSDYSELENMALFPQINLYLLAVPAKNKTVILLNDIILLFQPTLTNIYIFPYSLKVTNKVVLIFILKRYKKTYYSTKLNVFNDLFFEK